MPSPYLSPMTDRNRDEVGDPAIAPDVVWIAPRDAAPFVRLAAEAIAARLPRRFGAVDGTGTVIAVPSSRAVRLLEANLLTACETAGLRLDPPNIVTADRLSDRLAVSRESGDVPAKASRLERTVAWRRELAATVSAERRRLGVRGEDAWSAESVRSLASIAIALEDELGREGRTFADAEAAVPIVAGGILDEDASAVPDESERWAALGAVQRRVAARLGAAGLASQVDRERLLVERGRPTAERLFLVGFLEVSGAVRRLASLQPVTVVLPEPLDPSVRDGFGLPRPDAGVLAAIPLDSIRVAGSPRGQADEAIAFLAGLASRPDPPASDEVAIGVADPSLVPTVAAALGDAGLVAHDPAGRPVTRREPMRALAAAVSWRHGNSASTLGSLVRCPSVAGPRTSPTDPVAMLDDLVTETRLASLHGPLPKEPSAGMVVKSLMHSIDEKIETLEGPPVEPLVAAEAIAMALSRLDVDREPEDRRLLERELGRLASASPQVVGPISPLDAAGLILEIAASSREPGEPRPDEIELLGWLELLFEPAPHLCILGMNEGIVPDRGAAVAWLTPSLASALGLPDPARRLARDAAILEALRRFHPDLRLVFGRRTAAGDPAMPSRLLLGGSGPELARRVEALFREPPSVRRGSSGRRTTRFAVPAPPADLGATIQSMGVTDFKAYLADPFRFWLERRERLREVVTDAAELDPMAFGVLAHDVIDAAFSDEEIRASTDVAAVREAFRRELDRIVEARLGPEPRPAIRLQLRSLRARLARLAEREVAERLLGWTVVDVERSLVGTWSLEPAGGGTPMRITGRCDRIERNDSGPEPRFRVLDAKTFEKAKTPRKAHRAGRKGEERWIDLQLPLYRHFVAKLLGVEPASVATGYILLPPDPDDVRFVESDFTDAEYTDAIDEARRVIASIRAGVFPAGPSRQRDDPLRFILQEPVFAGGDDGSEEDPS